VSKNRKPAERAEAREAGRAKRSVARQAERAAASGGREGFDPAGTKNFMQVALFNVPPGDGTGLDDGEKVSAMQSNPLYRRNSELLMSNMNTMLVAAKPHIDPLESARREFASLKVATDSIDPKEAAKMDQFLNKFDSAVRKCGRVILTTSHIPEISEKAVLSVTKLS